jgi:hypothetical protein
MNEMGPPLTITVAGFSQTDNSGIPGPWNWSFENPNPWLYHWRGNFRMAGISEARPDEKQGTALLWGTCMGHYLVHCLQDFAEDWNGLLCRSVS